jgi:hypothetical protein
MSFVGKAKNGTRGFRKRPASNTTIRKKNGSNITYSLESEPDESRQFNLIPVLSTIGFNNENMNSLNKA